MTLTRVNRIILKHGATALDDQGLLIIEGLRLYFVRHILKSVGLLWSSDQPTAKRFV